MAKRLLTEAAMTNRKHQASQQGVALMMTLGVLSLVLILAMSFSFTARSSRQLSQNNAEVVRARLLANSGLNRVIAAIGFLYDEAQMADDTSVPGDPRYPRLYPATAPLGSFSNGNFAVDHPLYGFRAFWPSTSATPETGQLNSALSTQLGMGTTVIPSGVIARHGFIPEATAGSLPANASWHHVLSPNEVDGVADDRIIGRLAFLVLDESGKLDPSGIITINTEPVWNRATPDASFYDLNANGTRDHLATAGWAAAFTEGANIPRRGLSPQEIPLPFLALPSAANPLPSVPERFWTNVPTVGGTSVKSTWFGWRHIATTTAFEAPDWTAPIDRNFLHTLFPYSYDIEAYRHDPGTGEADYHRFNLWSVDWDGTAWDTAALQALYNGTPSLFWTAAPGGDINPTASTCAPALGGFTDAATTTRTLVNLVDFLDSDNAATFLPPGNIWNATVVGNEEQPYINEVGFLASYIMDDPDGIPGNADDNGTFTLEVFLEVANIYATNKAFTGTVRLNFTLTGSPTTSHDFAVTGTANANDYTVVSAQWTQNYAGATTPASVAFSISDCRVVLLDNWSPDNGEVADFAHALDSDLSVNLNGTGMGVETRYASVQVEDPRCNTLPTDWTKQDFDANISNITMSFTFLPGPPPSVTATGELNEVGPGKTPADPSTPPTAGSGYDDETVGDPVLGLSTAYIANRADITFWELGAVHRGHPWQTINLKAYNPSNTARSYTDGDAILLDQLKLGGFTEVRGRVNANSASRPVWGSVLNQIRLGWDYEDIHNSGALMSGTAISVASALNIADGVLALTANTAKGAPFGSRAEFVAIPALTDGTGIAPALQDTDRIQEEIIGKIANLLTVRQNLFTVLVTAQTVRDTGTNNPGTPNSGVYKTVAGTDYHYLIQAEHKLLATVYRDAFTNTFRVVNIETLED